MQVRTSLVLASSVAVAVSAFALPALADDSMTTKTTPNGPAERFGAKGQIAVSSDAALTIQSSSTSGVDGSTTTIQLEPSADYFVIDNLSVGGFIGLDYTKAGNSHATTFAIGPRIGYNFVLSDLLSIWPKGGLSFASTTLTTDATVPVGTTTPGTTTTVNASTSTSNSALALNIFVPLMFHPVQHFFAGFGPFLDTDLSGDAKTTTFGGKLTVGGWFDTH